MISGTPAVYGHLANAGPTTAVQQVAAAPAQHQSLPPKNRPRPESTDVPPSAIPSAVPSNSCVPYGSTHDQRTGQNEVTSEDVLEMRQMLAAYRMELERVKRQLDSAMLHPDQLDQETDISPSPDMPSIRRLSHVNPTPAAVKRSSRRPAMLVSPDLDDANQFENARNK